MTLDCDSFLSLCERLRKLGATHVEGFGFSATFAPVVEPAPTAQKTAAAPSALQDAAEKAKAARREKLQRLSPDELREQAYAKELGR